MHTSDLQSLLRGWGQGLQKSVLSRDLPFPKTRREKPGEDGAEDFCWLSWKWRDQASVDAINLPTLPRALKSTGK